MSHFLKNIHRAKNILSTSRFMTTLLLLIVIFIFFNINFDAQAVPGPIIGEGTVGYIPKFLDGITMPNVDNVTINSSSVAPDNTTQYIITITGSDVAGGANIRNEYVLINYQRNGIPPGSDPSILRGYVTFYYDGTYTGWDSQKDKRACTGGGIAVIQLTNGASYVRLDACSTSVAGNVRTTNFTVRFDPTYTTPTTDNDISGYVENNLVNTGWVNFNTNFNLSLPPSASGIILTVNNSNFCGSGVHATVSGTYNDPVGNAANAYEVLVDNDLVSNPNTNLAGMNPEFESGTIAAAITSGSTYSYTISSCPVNDATNVTLNPTDTRPQISCQMVWNNTYRAWSRVRNSTGLWSSWAQMGTYCNGGSCNATDRWTVPIHRFPQPGFTFTPPNPAVGANVNYTNTTSFSGSSSGQSYIWSFAGGSPATSTSQNPPQVNYAASGGYITSLTATDNAGSCTSTQTINIQRPVPKWREVVPR